VACTESWTARLIVSNRHPHTKVEMTIGFPKSVAGARGCSPSHQPGRLESELQTELNVARASRADERIAIADIGRRGRSAETSGPQEVAGIQETT